MRQKYRHCSCPQLPRPQLANFTELQCRKPATSLADPYPAPTRVPRFSSDDDCCDYESELAIIIGRTCKNVTEERALSYVLGYTAANDVSHRDTQFEQSQWCFSKGFDGACPIGRDESFATHLVVC